MPLLPAFCSLAASESLCLSVEYHKSILLRVKSFFPCRRTKLLIVLTLPSWFGVIEVIKLPFRCRLGGSRRGRFCGYFSSVFSLQLKIGSGLFSVCGVNFAQAQYFVANSHQHRKLIVSDLRTGNKAANRQQKIITVGLGQTINGLHGLFNIVD